MKQFLMIFLISFPFSMWLCWYLTGNYGKNTYGNFWNYLIGKEIDRKKTDKEIEEFIQSYRNKYGANQ